MKEPAIQTATIFIDVEFTEVVTDAESVATALDTLLKTTLVSIDDLGEYGKPTFDGFRTTGIQPTKFVAVVTVTDPDTNQPIEVEIRKTAGGYMVGIDGSYLEQDVGPVYDPFNRGVELEIPDDEE